ncbi:MAG: hypothetical protein AB7U46_05605 [Paenirhodobacter sp.]|uniref:hypothetical protein n=1 Tax=Paenirhodobacter sp. TaxID=1965326 RepID=UPI003D13DE79
MTNDFLTMFAAGILAAIVVFALRHALKRFTGRVLPKWAMPAAIGLSMLGVTIWGEYHWFSNMRAGLPASAEVIGTAQESAAWRPWTYLAPITTRAIVVDRAKIAHPAPGIATTDLLLLARWEPLHSVPVAYDCEKGARADLFGGAQVNADGSLTGAEWHPLEAGDAGLAAVCSGG